MIDESIRRFYSELSKIHEVKKCVTCTCFYEALDDLDEVVNNVDQGKLKQIKDSVAKWRKESEGLILHGCLGCDPWPAGSSLQRISQGA